MQVSLSFGKKTKPSSFLREIERNKGRRIKNEEFQRKLSNVVSELGIKRAKSFKNNTINNF